MKKKIECVKCKKLFLDSKAIFTEKKKYGNTCIICLKDNAPINRAEAMKKLQKKKIKINGTGENNATLDMAIKYLDERRQVEDEIFKRYRR